MDEQDKYTPYQIVGEETTEIGRFMIHLDTVEVDHKRFPYSYIQSKDSVAVLGIFEEQFILIKQYRHAIRSYIYEIPGGSIEQGETPYITALRELQEETGYEAVTMKQLGVFYPVPGSISEKCYLFLAKCQKGRAAKTEPLERIRVCLVSRDRFQQMISENHFRQSMGLVAWLYYCNTEGTDI